MRILFVAALGAALLSTPAAAGIKAYCEQMREVLAPAFEYRIYDFKRHLVRAKRSEAEKTCDDKHNFKDEKTWMQCVEKAQKKYRDPEKPRKMFRGETLDRRKTKKLLSEAAASYGAYCKKF